MEDLRKVKKISTDSKYKKGLTLEEINSKKERIKLVKEKNIIDNKTTKILTFDIETWGLVPNNLALAIFFDGLNYSIFYTIDEVIEFIETLDFTKVFIFAHNGAKFDYSIFFEKILNEEYKLRKYGDVSKIEYVNKLGTKIVFRDTIFMLQGSLDGLGKAFCNKEMQKLTIDEKFKNPIKYGFNRNEFDKDKKAFNLKHINNEDIEYCKRDTELLYEIIHNEFVMNDLDIVNNNTIASISFEKLNVAMIESRNKFYKSKNLEVDKNILTSFDIKKSFDKCFQSIYKGGLTFVLNHINDVETNNKIVCFDVNSMYPGVMTKLFPDTSKLQLHNYERLDEDKNLWLDMIINYPNGLSNVVLKIREDLNDIDKEIVKKIPLTQYSENGGMSYFNLSNGKEYRLTLLNEEISIIMEFYNVDVELSIHCNKEDLYYPFKDYMEDTYNQRLKAKKSAPAKAQILKLLMNSSYGRLGMQNQKDKMIIDNLRNIKKWLEDTIINKLNYTQNKVFDMLEMYQFIKKYVDSINIKNVEDFDYDLFKKYNEIDEELLYLVSYINMNENLFNELKITNFRKIIDKDYSNDKYEYKSKEDLYIVSSKTRKVESINSNFCLASTITSKSRCQLIRMMIKVSRSKLGVVHYCDTDSIHISTNDVKKLEDFLIDDLDDNQLGKWKNEGVYDLGVWLAKKHYYIFNKNEEGKYIYKKGALKGFRIEKDLDYFIENRNVEVVKKLYTRLTHLDINNQNQIYENKSFMNFTINTNLKDELFEYDDFSNIQQQIDEKRNVLQNLFFELCNIAYVEEDNQYIKVSDYKNQRMNELNEKIIKNVEDGLYDIGNVEIVSQSLKNQINKGFKEIKVKKPRKSRAKEVINYDNYKEFLGV